MAAASFLPARPYKFEDVGRGRNKYTLNERNPEKALCHLEELVSQAGPMSFRAVVVDKDKGTLLLHDNGKVVVGIHYPVLTCGVPALVSYVHRVFEMLLWGDYFDYIQIAGANRLYIEAFMKDQ